jgi:hypothetical protein
VVNDRAIGGVAATQELVNRRDPLAARSATYQTKIDEEHLDCLIDITQRARAFIDPTRRDDRPSTEPLGKSLYRHPRGAM